MDNFTLATQLVQYLIVGLTIGSIYAMVAIGFNIIYNVTEIINFAQGEFVMLGGLLMATLCHWLGLPVALIFPLVMLAVTGVGVLLDRLAIRPVRQPTVMTLIMATIAASILLKGAAMLIWGKEPYDVPAFSGRTPLMLMGASIQPQNLWVMGVLGVVVALLTHFYEHTIMGKAMTACADNPSAARLLGINVRKMVMLSFGLSAGIGALAGIVITPISLMDYDRGAMLAVKGFGALILGGLGSFPGAVVGGLLMGLIESFGAGLVSSAYKDVFALLFLLLVLFLKPSGLLKSGALAKMKRF